MSPASIRTLTGLYFHNSKDTLTSILSSSGIVGSGTLADVQIGDRDANKERNISRLVLPGCSGSIVLSELPAVDDIADALRIGRRSRIAAVLDDLDCLLVIRAAL